ncbi:MAG: hypothetical protein R2784_06925 [Saprospiraceae bacterium]
MLFIFSKEEKTNPEHIDGTGSFSFTNLSFGQCNCNPITQNASPDINCTLTFSTILLSDINCTYPINVEIKDGPITHTRPL